MTLTKNIINWLKEYNDKVNLSFIVGVSGGIDSALVSTLCAETNVKTYVVSLPILQNENQLVLAREHMKWLSTNYSNVECLEIDLTDLFLKTKETLFEYSNQLGFANTRSRLRMLTLYQLSSHYNGLVVGTGNKIEDFGVGFFTKYGDGGVDISPIADLTKTQVRLLSKELGINDKIITTKPTDGLWDDDRTDEDQIGATYEELEWSMNYTNKWCLLRFFTKLTKRQKQILDIYTNLNKKNKHKMVSIPFYKQ